MTLYIREVADYTLRMTNSMHTIVVGQGLAGASFVAALAGAGRITMLGKQLPEQFIDKKDERPISLSYSTVVFLKNLNLWSALEPHACTINKVHVSEQGRLGSLELAAKQVGIDALGYVVPFHLLQTTLLSHAIAQKNVTCLTVDDIDALVETDQGVRVTVQIAGTTKTLEANQLIAADGVHSRCRTLLDIHVKETSHQDVALSAILTLETPQQGIAYERFTKAGVLAILPMWDAHQYRLVWTLDKTRCDQLTEVTLRQQIETTFGSRIGAIKAIARQGSYPLTTVLATKQATRHCVLVGDSAHRIYPIAAQGYNLTVRDIAALVSVLSDKRPLSDYVASRHKDQRFITNFTQGLEWVFGLQLPLLDHLRSSSLFAMDLLPPLKRRLIRKMLGRGTKQPRLLCE